ncbi:LytTR family transcriptional regulator DNA-binding domain-containing protein [Halobacillus kuroshimensis]|uniref:LytTR family transcriptional regulator DNA-binding domain-containing protein n=1 Tax=Halobacillus kuroshimensis TaxID=302481 RepID=UPI0004169E97|nr:LytTR family transcriptional regulator DNA-binding domain-containing protein [Halobacillus kuroshimensis]
MDGLTITKAEKSRGGTTIFSPFDLRIEPGQVVSVYVHTDLRHWLIDILNGDETLSGGCISFHDRPSPIPLGLLSLDAPLYERLKVKELFRFHRDLYHSSVSLESVLDRTRLSDLQHHQVKKLTFSEKKRVQLGCLILQDPPFFLMEEPDQNVDLETKQILMKILQRLKEEGKTVLILTSNLESAILMGDHTHRLHQDGIHKVEKEHEESAEPETDGASVTFHKIPTKVQENMILFDPPEVDYIESIQGQSYVHIRGEAFQGMFTLNDLEARLKLFGFFRCHRSYIVNLQKVRKVITWTKNSYSLQLDNAEKTEVPLSKGKMAELKELLGLK